MPGFTAKMEPLSYSVSAANLTGIHVCIVISGNICHILYFLMCLAEWLCVILICLLVRLISVFTQCMCKHWLKTKEVSILNRI